MFRTIVVSIVVLLVASACTFEPRYRQVHDLIPPVSQQGKTCAAAGRTNQLLCEQSNATDFNFCEQRADTEYQRCTADKIEEHKRCVADARYQYRKADDTEHYVNATCSRITPNDCIRERCLESPRNCSAPHRQCFSGCGGTIKTRTVCVANCP